MTATCIHCQQIFPEPAPIIGDTDLVRFMRAATIWVRHLAERHPADMQQAYMRAQMAAGRILTALLFHHFTGDETAMLQQIGATTEVIVSALTNDPAILDTEGVLLQLGPQILQGGKG